MNVNPLMTRYVTGLQSVTARTSAYLQPDGHYGLNNAAVFWTDEGAVLVDSAFDVPRARRIAEAVENSGRERPNIAALIVTHDHGDHSFGACAIPTARMIMSAAAKAALREAASSMTVRFGSLEGDARAMMETLLADKFDFSDVRYRAPTETFEGEARFDFAGTQLRMIEFPNVHTVSDSIVVDEREGVAAMGDLMFADSHIPMFMPSARRWADAMERVLSMGLQHFIPGHGRLCNRDDVRGQRDYLLWILDQAERRFRRGMPVDAAADDLAANLGPYEHLQRADTLINSLDTLYREISPDHPRATMNEHLAQRWRFRMRWRGRLPGLTDPLPLNTRLGGFRTLSQLRMLEVD
jgi:glyoxylase-like metal-dependent hydrolase (beta-lactamase superfamily II)